MTSSQTLVSLRDMQIWPRFQFSIIQKEDDDEEEEEEEILSSRHLHFFPTGLLLNYTYVYISTYICVFTRFDCDFFTMKCEWNVESDTYQFHRNSLTITYRERQKELKFMEKSRNFASFEIVLTRVGLTKQSIFLSNLCDDPAKDQRDLMTIRVHL